MQNTKNIKKYKHKQGQHPNTSTHSKGWRKSDSLEFVGDVSTFSIDREYSEHLGKG